VDSFDIRAATWDDDPAKVERAAVVAAAIRRTVPLDRSTRLLEYGAGTGLVSEALRADVGPVTLADTSAGMREVIAGKVAAGALDGARVWDLDLTTAPLPDDRFDLIVTVMTLHHVVDVCTLLAAFAALLDAGGHLCVVDLDAEDGSFHGDGFVGHHGFERAELADAMAAAGLVDVALRDCFEVRREDRRYPLFLATARPRGDGHAVVQLSRSAAGRAGGRRCPGPASARRWPC
jgi:predicted TPR repeat methyltransferase